MEVEDYYCTKCRNRNLLHEGDRIAFAGDMSHFSLEPLIKKAEFKGLRNHGLSKHAKVLVTKNVKVPSRSINRAKAMGIPVLSEAKFAAEIARICPGDWGKPKKPPFSISIIKGSTVLYIGADESELAALNKFLKSREAKLVSRMTTALTAAVCSNLMKENGGKIKVLDRLGVPAYAFSRLRLNQK